MSAELDNQCFEWLYGQVADPENKNKAQTYWKLLKQLFEKEFVWLIPNDDNRLEDGRDLRREFLSEMDLEADRHWLELGCSTLELMIGLSRKLSFEDMLERGPDFWFWKMIHNLDLENYTDKRRFTKQERQDIEDVLDRVIHRNYGPDGHGGFFPLEHAQENQRNIELWYQLSAYILEMN